jgi:hypothetical protein
MRGVIHNASSLLLCLLLLPPHPLLCLLLSLQGVNTGHILKTLGLTKHGCFVCMCL